VRLIGNRLLIALYDIAEIIIKPIGALLSRKIVNGLLRIGLAVFILASASIFFFLRNALILVSPAPGAGAAFFSVMSIPFSSVTSREEGHVLGITGRQDAGYVLAPPSVAVSFTTTVPVHLRLCSALRWWSSS